MITDNCTFGDRLKSLRIEKNLNQATFGELLGEVMGTKRVSSSAIGAYERNERQPAFHLLQAIANYFNVSIDYLLCNSDERLTVESFSTQTSYELDYLLRTYDVTLQGKEISDEQKQRILDVATAILWDKSL